MPFLDMDALQDSAKRYSLRQRRKPRTARERNVPAIALALGGAPAEFEGDAAEDQADQHRNHRGVERGHQDGVGQRKRRHQAAAAQYQPGFVAIPDRRDAVHDHVAIGLGGKQWKQDAEPKVEAVHYDIDEHRERDDERPDGRDIGGNHRTAPSVAAAPVADATPAAGVMPAVRVGTSWLGPCSPGCGGAAIKRKM